MKWNEVFCNTFKAIGDGWLSQMLKAREPLLAYWQVKHCLFGLHLVDSDKPIDIVDFVLDSAR